MASTINIEQALLENLRLLPPEKQQEALDFVEFLVQKVENISSSSPQTNQIPNNLVTRSHDAFLKGYAPEDEGLYDDY